MSSAAANSPTLFTIGHSNHPFETFASLLQAHKIDVLVDVRTSPYSKFAQQFARETLGAVLPRSSIKYLFFGKELGGRPTGQRYYDAEGHVLYGELAGSDLFKSGIERLTTGIQNHRVAIMCSEEDPSVCHRHLLVARVMHERGVPISHVRGDGRLESYGDTERTAKDHEGRRETLFGEEVPHPWRSLRSVLQGGTPVDSLET